MNFYVVVEGENATKKLYSSWISYVNNDLTQIDYLKDFTNNNYYILAGFGQPNYWQRVDSAVEDVNKISSIDRLVVSIDSENRTFEEKLAEAKSRVDRIGCRVEVKYVIQHFCLEAWLLGNIQVFRKHPQDIDLIDYLKLFDIRSNDPEKLPAHTQKAWNRAKFALHYLKAGLRDKFNNKKYYTKSNPGIASEEGYFHQIKKRYEQDNHIKSFGGFLEAFS